MAESPEPIVTTPQEPPYDPDLDPMVDFERPYERDPDQPGEPVKMQADPRPSLDTEQIAGGGWTVTSYGARNRIPESHRREGITTCYISKDMTHWILQGGIENRHWILWRGGDFTGGMPDIIRGGDANPMNFKPAARFVFY